MYNKLLDNQLKEHFGETGQVSNNFIPFFKVISDSYDHYEKGLTRTANLAELSLKGINEVTIVSQKDTNETKRSQKIFDIETKIFSDMFFQAPFCMGVLKGPDHIFEMANPLYLQLIGKDDIIGKSVKIVLPEIATQGFIELLDGVYKTGKSFSANEMLIKLDKGCNGKLIDTYLNFIYLAYKDKAGSIDGIFFFAIDVTEQVLSRKKTEESEKRYRSLIEQANDAIGITDSCMKFYDMNPSGCRMLGYSKEEFLKLSIADLFLTEDLEANPLKIADLQSGKEIRGERKFKTKSGAVIEVDLSGKLMKDGRFIIFGRDISERKKAEKIIKESELRYRSLIEQATDAICIADKSLQFIDMNPYACGFLGYTKEEALQLFVPDILFPEDMATNPINRFDTIKLNEIIRNERRFKRKDGSSVVMEVSSRLMEDGRFIMFGHDVSERKKAEEIIKRSEASLDLKNKELEIKNKDLEHFAYVASHDLQEPLRTTSSFVNLLREQYKGRLDEKADKYLDYIADSTDRMRILITDLLDYSRIGNNKELQQVDCNTILNELLQDLDTTLKETGAEIKVDPLPVISGYQTEMKQLFLNLVVNAIKFRKKNIIPQITISARQENASWIFSIQDNGIGIAEDHIDRIFVIFQRLHTRTEYEGTGIGLANCKKIVGLHGGDIWVESKPDEGATFYFTIP